MLSHFDCEGKCRNALSYDMIVPNVVASCTRSKEYEFMGHAMLEMLANRVRGDLERSFENRPARFKEALHNLLRMLLTAEPPQDLARLGTSGQVWGLHTHLETLERHLQSHSKLPEALCARYKYKASEAKVQARYKISRRTWDYFHGLAWELEWNPELHVPLISYEKYGWHDELEERFMELEVVLDTQALEGMLISALEAYLSPRKTKRKGYEVYGINLGMSREVNRRVPRDGPRITRYVSVMRSQPQLSAESGYGFVRSNPRSLDAILSATGALYPHYQPLGDFHSHPYDDFSLLDRMGGWEYTSGDEEANIDLARALSERGHRVLVAFVIGIARCNQKVLRSHFKGMENTFQVSLGNCRAIIAAYRSLESGRLTKSNICLRPSGTTG